MEQKSVGKEKGRDKMGCDIHTIVEIKKENTWVGLEECLQEFSSRNYALFAFLAGVRNSFNTKGFKTKGFPEDMSKESRELEQKWDGDMHSKSYLTLKELEESDKSDHYSHKCRIVRAFWEKFKELGGILPDGMEVEEDFKVDSIIDAMQLAFCPEVIVKWQSSEKEQKEFALYKGIEALKEIAEKEQIKNHEDIRIVFGFDN